jgi:hypothetical protein
MGFDKFGLGALIVGILVVALLLQVYFMTPDVGGWGLEGLWNAIATMAVGVALLIGVALVLIGLMLLVL